MAGDPRFVAFHIDPKRTLYSVVYVCTILLGFSAIRKA